MAVGFKWCGHEKVDKVGFWSDTAGADWQENECGKCGRRWRVRLMVSLKRRRALKVFANAA